MNIIFSANRGEEEPWRLARLLRLATIIYNGRDWMTSEEVTNIISFDDHWGDLTVNFNELPEEDFCQWIRDLWAKTENEPNCFFEVLGEPVPSPDEDCCHCWQAMVSAIQDANSNKGNGALPNEADQ